MEINFLASHSAERPSASGLGSDPGLTFENPPTSGLQAAGYHRHPCVCRQVRSDGQMLAERQSVPGMPPTGLCWQRPMLGVAMYNKAPCNYSSVPAAAP